MRQHSELQSTDYLIFPDEIIFRPCEEGWLVVAVPTGNWLVIKTDFQKRLLQQLIEGQIIGEVYTALSRPDEQSQFKQLLQPSQPDVLPASTPLQRNNILRAIAC